MKANRLDNDLTAVAPGRFGGGFKSQEQFVWTLKTACFESATTDAVPVRFVYSLHFQHHFSIHHKSPSMQANGMTCNKISKIFLACSSGFSIFDAMAEKSPRKPARIVSFSTPEDVAHALETARNLGYNRSRLIVDALKINLRKRGFLKSSR